VRNIPKFCVHRRDCLLPSAEFVSQNDKHCQVVESLGETQAIGIENCRANSSAVKKDGFPAQGNLDVGIDFMEIPTFSVSYASGS
jgi:hypothetical protein